MMCLSLFEQCCMTARTAFHQLRHGRSSRLPLPMLSERSRLPAEGFLLLPLFALTACGGGTNAVATPTPAAKPQIVYTSPGVPGTVSAQQLYTGNLDGFNAVELPQDNLNKFLSHFSPDGTHLVYTKFLSGKFGDLAPVSDIFSYDFATSTETQLTSTAPPSWPPGRPTASRSPSAPTTAPASI